MATRSTTPEVLIVHARGSWSGLPRLPKLIRAAGARVTIFAPPNSRLWKASYIDERVPAPTTEGNFSAALREHLARAGDRYTWVLVGDENAVVELATQKDTSWLTGWFPVEPTAEKLDLVTSKAAFTVDATAQGVAMPASQVCNSLEEAKTAAARIGFPVMIKAARGFAGNGVRKATCLAELVAEFDDLQHRVPVVVQKFEVGRVGSTQVLFDHGRLACWASSYKLAVFPEPFGPSSARELMVHRDMEDTLKRIGRTTGFNGLCGVDWLHRTSDDALLVLEFNPRPAPVVHLGYLSGADFSAGINAMLAGRPETRPPVDVGAREIYLFPQHLVRCITGRYWADLLHWLPGVAYTDIPWDQPRLLASQSVMLLHRLAGVVGEKLSETVTCWRNRFLEGATAKNGSSAPQDAARFSL
jgi:predicted ATP-grasp superfamily ATP-dependent carboligase